MRMNQKILYPGILGIICDDSSNLVSLKEMMAMLTSETK